MPNRRRIPSPIIKADDLEFPSSEIQGQLARIQESPEFMASEAQRAFLHYVIAKTLAGQADEIKGYTIATEVFGRSPDFDQATDPVVSIQANKLRRALERYYLVAGQADPIRIDIPKGSYVPTFQACDEMTAIAPPASPKADSPGGVGLDTGWPILAVQPLVNLTGNPDLDPMGIVIASEIATEITRCQEIQVYIQPEERRKQRGSDSGAQFVLRGRIHQEATCLKMNLVLTDPCTGRQLWADAHHADLEPAHLLSAGVEVARIVAGKIAAEFGFIARHMNLASRCTPTPQLTSYEALLRYYKFGAWFTPDTFRDAQAALRYATENDPECALVWSMRARLYGINYANELFDAHTPIDTAVAYARTAVRLDPADQRNRLSVAYSLMLADDLQPALAEAERALALNPDSFIFAEILGYVLTLLGDWQRGCTLIRKAIAVNPYHNTTAHYALWVDLLRRQDDEQAYRETLNLRTPNLFWEPLAKAASLGRLGLIEEGRKAAAELLRLKPDFSESGLRLIGRYVKFEEIVESIVDGLARVGVVVEGPKD